MADTEKAAEADVEKSLSSSPTDGLTVDRESLLTEPATTSDEKRAEGSEPVPQEQGQEATSGEKEPQNGDRAVSKDAAGDAEEEEIEYPNKFKLTLITIALCLAVFCMALVCFCDAMRLRYDAMRLESGFANALVSHRTTPLSQRPFPESPINSKPWTTLAGMEPHTSSRPAPCS